MSDWIYYVLDAIQVGFTIYTAFCLLCRWLGRDNMYREAVNIQSCVNFVLAIGIFLNFSYWIIGIFFPVNQIPGWDNDAAVSSGYKAGVDYELVVQGILILMIGITFLFRRPRRSWIISLLAFLILNSDYIIDWIGYNSSDYEHMVSVDRPFLECLWKFLLFTTMVLLFYLWQGKRKKLPYDSALIN